MRVQSIILLELRIDEVKSTGIFFRYIS